MPAWYLRRVIIAFSGKKKHGKSTAAKILSQNLPTATTAAFADALKREVAEACGISEEYLNAHKENFRLIMQGWGTDFRRTLCGRDYWVERMAERIPVLKTQHRFIIIDDCRFGNEAELVRQSGGKVFRVIRPGLDDSDAHESECDLDDYQFDDVIINDGDIVRLELAIKTLALSLQ